ncbi:hypothetical protein [Bradyrhizobium sp. CCBAU 51627]
MVADGVCRLDTADHGGRAVHTGRNKRLHANRDRCPCRGEGAC